MKTIIYYIIFIVSGIFGILYGQQGVIIDRELVSKLKITDPDLISFFIEAYLIPEENVTELQFIDATDNGFGEEDLIKCYPSEETYYLFPSEEAQKVLNKWDFTSNFQSVTQIDTPEVFESLEQNKAENWILAGLLRALNWNYKALPMKIYFERSDTTIVFEMWGFQPEQLQWAPPPAPPGVPETTFDILHVFQSDTLIEADTTYYDQFFIYRSVADTFFMSNREFHQTPLEQKLKYQPGLVPPAKKDEN